MDTELTAEALAPYLTQQAPELGRIEQVEKFAEGQSNPTYKLICSEGVFVLRSKPPGRLLKSAHMVEREFEVMAALADTDVPVPHMIHLATDAASPLGRAFFVMSFVEGRILFDPALPEETPDGRAAIYDAMNDVLARLHLVDPASVGLEGFGKPGNYFARQTDRWARQYRATCETPATEMEQLITWLLRHMPNDDGQVALVHGDFRLDNMVIDHNGKIAALLDWELSTLGHPLADLAYQCMQWRLPHKGGMRGLGGLDRGANGIPEEADYIDRYCARRGISPPENWAFYLAFSYFRLAAILEGVVSRARAGNASNPRGAERFVAVIAVLVSQANAVIEESCAA